MLKPRITPTLLIHQGGVIKTRQFGEYKYIGDPINTVRIFNEKEVDELIVLDIDATVLGKEPNYSLINAIASECRMPLCYGGGVRSAEVAKKIISMGVEKIALSSALFENLFLIEKISEELGRQSVVAVIDICRIANASGSGYQIFSHNGKKLQQLDVFEFIKNIQNAGVGEIIFNSIDRDGMMNGYDIELAKKMRNSLDIPITILGGCGSINHIKNLFEACSVVSAGVGSFFVFKGTYRAVLISYLNQQQKKQIFTNTNQT